MPEKQISRDNRDLEEYNHHTGPKDIERTPSNLQIDTIKSINPHNSIEYTADVDYTW